MYHFTPEKLQGVPEGAILRQWMELVNEFLEAHARHAEYETHLPADVWHKLRLMKSLTLAVAPEAATLDIPPKYHCNKCDRDYDKPRHYDWGGSHYGGSGYGCPNHSCQSTDYKLNYP